MTPTHPESPKVAFLPLQHRYNLMLQSFPTFRTLRSPRPARGRQRPVAKLCRQAAQTVKFVFSDVKVRVTNQFDEGREDRT
jgi:hypothetical protein